MNQILGELGKSQKFKELLNQIENKQSPIAISGLNDVGAVQIETAINQFGKKPICIITYNEIQAKKIYENVKYFTENVVLFPKKEIVTYDYIAESKDLPYRRIETLNEIQSKRNLIVVTTIEAIMQKLPAKDKLYKNKLKFKIGDSFNLDKLKQKLVELGYTRCELIEGRGKFSIRGGIVDISISYKTGIRIEFWGDEIDSIRDFNISTQRSINTKENVIIYDYVDNHIPMFDNMYMKRLKAYKQIGYELASGLHTDKQTVNAIYDGNNYSENYCKDLLEANKNIIISSPAISGTKVYELINLLKEKQLSGVQITIVTWAPESYGFGDAAYWMQLHEDMRKAGFYIKTVEESCERFAVIDQEVVWYGNINLLAKNKIDDSIMSLRSKEVAGELMELTFGNNS